VTLHCDVCQLLKNPEREREQREQGFDDKKSPVVSSTVKSSATKDSTVKLSSKVQRLDVSLVNRVSV